jgi:integrase
VGNPYVFSGRGNAAFNSFADRKAALDRAMPASTDHWQLHDLRRTARSLLSRAGVQPHIAERVLGHKIKGVEGTYDRHLYADEKAEALRALATLVERIVDPPSADNVVALR